MMEPFINDYSDTSSTDILKADISIRGVWQPQAMASFDIRVIDTDAPSYMVSTPQSVIAKAEKEKKTKYSSACEAKHKSFTPLCISVDGVMGTEMKSFVKD